MKKLAKITSFLKWQLAVMLLLVAALSGTEIAAFASTAAPVWTTQGDFETNASTTNNPTTRTTTIDTGSVPGDVKIIGAKDFVTTASITCVTPTKIYTTGVDRTSLKVFNSAQNQINTIVVPKRIAGVVYNAANGKLYVGQYDDNKVLVIDENTDTIVKTITVGTTVGTVNGVYAAAYYGAANKVYLVNAAEQKVYIFEGAQDAPITSLTVGAGSTTAAVDTTAKRVYLTDKSNAYVTVIDAENDQIVQNADMGTAINLIGGQAPGNVGLQIDASSRGGANADFMRLSWHNDPLQAGQAIQLQMRTAANVASLDTATYTGPDANSWYERTEIGNTGGSIDLPSARAAEFQLKLSYDGVNTPVVHDVDLAYFCNIMASAGPGGEITPSGDVPVEIGVSPAFEVKPDFGYHIQDVIVNGLSLGPITSYPFQVSGTCGQTITAIFAPNVYPITATACSGGTITPSADVPFGTDKTFTVVADTGYYITEVKVDGISQELPTNPGTFSYTFTNVSAPHTISACFARIQYTIQATAETGGTITPSGTITKFYGENQIFDIVPSSCYHIVNILVDGVAVEPPPVSFTFSNITRNHTIVAQFDNHYTVTFTAGAGGSIEEGNTEQTVLCGGSTTGVKAKPSIGYRFIGWTGTNGFSSNSNPIVVQNVSSNLSITANFVQISYSDWLSNDLGTTAFATAIDTNGVVYTEVAVGTGTPPPQAIARFTKNSTAPEWTSNQLGSIKGLSVDAAGNVFTADMNTKTFSKFTLPGKSAVWSATSTAYVTPHSITTDKLGNVFAADQNNVYVFNPTADPTAYTYLKALLAPMGGNPYYGIAPDSNNNLFFQTSAGYFGFYAATTYSRTLYSKSVDSAVGWNQLAINKKSDDAYFAAYIDSARSLARIPHGATTHDWKVSIGGSSVAGVAADESGNVYVAIDGEIKMFTPPSTEVQWHATAANGHYFASLAVDPSGKYIAATEGGAYSRVLHIYTRNGD